MDGLEGKGGCMNAIRLTLNGHRVETNADSSMRLLDFLRDDMGLTGTKEGCGKGECGACSVLLNGTLVNACLVLLGQCDGATLQTVEGMASASGLHPIQRAMVETGAVQCGFCTPGLVMAAAALLAQTPHPTPQEVRRGIEGNLCRCTGYAKIEEAILQAAKDEEITV